MNPDLAELMFHPELVATQVALNLEEGLPYQAMLMLPALHWCDPQQ